MTRTLIATVAVFALAASAVAQEKKPAAPATAPAAAPAAGAPAAAAPPKAGAPAAAAAAPAPAPPKPEPSKELTAFMKPFEGTWKCDTKFPPNAFGPGSPEINAKSTVSFKKDLDGFFYRGEYKVAKQKGVPMPLHGLFYIGWDTGTKGVVVQNMDNMGTTGISFGKIEGDTINYGGEAYMMGMKVKTRESMGRKSDKEGFHKAEIDMGHGWQPFGEDTCKK